MNDTTKKLMTYKQASERYALGMTTIRNLARKSGALRKIGKSARIDIDVMDKFVSTLEELN